jgi:hypothetical protein
MNLHISRRTLAIALSATVFSLGVFAISTAGQANESAAPKAYDSAHDFFSTLSSKSETCTGADQGYAGLSANATDKSFTVSWVRPIPQEILNGIKGLPTEITVNVVDAKYSWCEMQQSIEAIAASDLAADIASMAPANDGSGVVVATNHKTNGAEVKAMVVELDSLPGVTVAVSIGAVNQQGIAATN